MSRRVDDERGDRPAQDSFERGSCRGALRVGGFDCRAGWRSAGTTLSVKGGAAPIALDVHLEDGGMVHQPVDGGERHRWIGEDPAPFAEGLVGGDHQGTALVAGADQLKQNARLGLVLGDVGEVVEDQQIEAVEPTDGRLQAELAPGDLQLLDEIGGAGERNYPGL